MIINKKDQVWNLLQKNPNAATLHPDMHPAKTIPENARAFRAATGTSLQYVSKSDPQAGTNNRTVTIS